MSQITDPITIPIDILQHIAKDNAAVRLELAIWFYTEFTLSSGKAAAFAGISRIAFFQELAQRGIAIAYDESDARHDVEIMEQFKKTFPHQLS